MVNVHDVSTGNVCCVPVTVMLPVENTCTVALRVLILYEAAG